MFDDLPIQKTLFLSTHDEVVGLVLVVNDILKVDTRLLLEILEELLVEDESDTCGDR